MPSETLALIIMIATIATAIILIASYIMIKCKENRKILSILPFCEQKTASIISCCKANISIPPIKKIQLLQINISTI
jgi:hypothetical protein